jgi:hypothetical protein
LAKIAFTVRPAHGGTVTPNAEAKLKLRGTKVKFLEVWFDDPRREIVFTPNPIDGSEILDGEGILKDNFCVPTLWNDLMSRDFKCSGSTKVLQLVVEFDGNEFIFKY